MSSGFRRGATVLVALALAIVGLPTIAAATPAVRAADQAAPGGRLVVVWRERAPLHLAIAGIKSDRTSPGSQRSVISAASGRAGLVAASLRADPRVIAVVPDAVVHATGWPSDGPPSDSLYGEQEDLAQIHVPEVWPTTTGDPSVIVAVIDSGVDLGHPDLAGVTVVSPRNETFNGTDVTDDIGHGTHVTGTIFARTNNATGIAGIAPRSKLMPIKVLDGSGSGFFSDVLDGVDWARTHGADVINLSLGGVLTPAQIAMFQPTFSAARAAGILVVAAAGNSGDPLMFYPAGLNGVVSVGAVDASDVEADFSTFNRAVDLSAPGVETLSTVPTDEDPLGYERFSGTSMASPHVAGVAALVWADRPGLNVAELEAVLRASATDLGAAGRDDHYGSGRIDAEAALSEAVPVPLPDLDPAPGPAGAFTIDFTAPLAPVSQTSTSFSVSWTTSHDVIDGVLVRLVWPLVHGGACPAEDALSDYEILPFVSPTQDTGLRPGSCYRYEVLAIDENSEFGDVISPPITIVDHTRPTVHARTPKPGAGHVPPRSSPRVVFSEPVSGVSSTTVRLKNVATDKWVKVKVSYDAGRSTATIDPVLWMFPGRRYAIYLTTNIHDGSGNRLQATHWSFTTSR